ncbi:MAG TPA: hypothetical protein VF745_08045 [Steroidobacteraceae bacterium]
MFRTDPDQRLSAEIVLAGWRYSQVLRRGADRFYEIQKVIRSVHEEHPRGDSTADAECMLDTRWQYDVASRARDHTLITTLYEELSIE